MTAALALSWLPLDTQIVVVGALCAMSCALLGCFLVLRKMSMMGDAISHAVLPGLALAFLLTDSRGSLAMLVGAAVVGVLTAVFTEWIHHSGKVEQGASMGVVFTILFALGLILIRQSADHVDLDPDCVLHGAIEFVPLDTLRLGNWEVPRAGLIIGGVLLLNLLFVLTLYKELKLCTFDPALATTLGINARLMHYALMTLVAVTTVAAFESVGSILVIAMMIVPPAAAHLLTDRLSAMLVVSMLLAAAAAAGGHLAAITTPEWLGFPGVSTSTAGMMGVVAGVIFLIAMLFAPRHGVVSRLLHRLGLALRIVREDLLALLYRGEERGWRIDRAGLGSLLHSAAGTHPLLCRLALLVLRRSGAVSTDDGNLRLSERGRAHARNLVRSHRLWEAYLDRHLHLPGDHLHLPAERLEHVTTPGLQAELAASLDDPPLDPQGHPIPAGPDERPIRP